MWREHRSHKLNGHPVVAAALREGFGLQRVYDGAFTRELVGRAKSRLVKVSRGCLPWREC